MLSPLEFAWSIRTRLTIVFSHRVLARRRLKIIKNYFILVYDKDVETRHDSCHVSGSRETRIFHVNSCVTSSRTTSRELLCYCYCTRYLRDTRAITCTNHSAKRSSQSCNVPCIANQRYFLYRTINRSVAQAWLVGSSSINDKLRVSLVAN